MLYILLKNFITISQSNLPTVQLCNIFLIYKLRVFSADYHVGRWMCRNTHLFR